MKRFYKQASVGEVEGGFRVELDGRGVKTPKGAAQVVPSRALAERLAQEWAAQGEKIDASTLPLRDLTEFAIDIAAADPAAEIATILPYGETDTLCYRADPDEPLFARQQEVWEPLLASIEARHGLNFTRASGIVHRPQSDATMATLKGRLEGMDAFTLAATKMMASLAASLAIALAALEEDADAEVLWAAANLEEDWQAELWGWDPAAKTRRDAKQADFARAMEFARLARP